MTTLERIVTEIELRRNNGDRGAPKWIAHDGVVYDVTDCPKWRTDMHERLHFPGQDLTTELPDAPHKQGCVYPALCEGGWQVGRRVIFGMR